MRNILFCLVLLLVLTACGSNQRNAAPTVTVAYAPIFVNYTSTAVKNAAKAGLPTFVRSLGSQYANFGFLSQDELSFSQVGNPYHVFSMTNSGKINQAISDTGQWSFPVMVNNEYRCMLNVDKVNDEWQAVGVGAAHLASWLQDAEKGHPSLSFSAKGLIKIYDHDTTILMLNPSEIQPSFLLLPPVTDMVKHLPQYSSWVNTDPVPVLSFEEIFLIYAGQQ
jgi:hypothetical protein